MSHQTEYEPNSPDKSRKMLVKKPGEKYLLVKHLVIMIISETK